MEPINNSSLKNEGLQISTAIALFVFVLFFAIPALAALLMMTFAEGGNQGSLSPTFWRLILQSYGWGFLQAFLSATLSLTLAILGASYLAFRSQAMHPRLLQTLRACGYLVFSLPSSALALAILSILPSDLPGWAQQGMLPVVFAHVFWNLLLLLSIFYEKLCAWRRGEGTRLIESARALGARPTEIFFKLQIPALLPEIKFWFSAIFLWALYSFGTVLILGGGPGAATPEVLSFYHLFSLYDPTRLLVLLPVQLCVNLCFIWAFKRHLKIREATLSTESDSIGALMPSSADNIFRKLCPTMIFPLMALLILFYLAATLLWQLSSENPIALIQDAAPFLFRSLLLGLLVAGMGFFLLFLSVTAGARLHSILFLALSFSPAVIAIVWSQNFAIYAWQWPLPFRIFLTALLTALSQWPLFDLWISLRAEQSPRYVLESAASLGASKRQRILWLRWRSHRGLLIKCLFLFYLFAMGDLLFPALFLQDWKTLAVWAQERAAQYQFGGPRIFLLVVWASLLLGLFLQTTNSKVKRHVGV